jgi:hypothetical protein
MMHARRIALIGLLLLLITTGCTLSLAGTATTDSTATPAVLPGQPQVQILPRLANTAYREGVLVYILATVSNAGANIARLEVSVDGIIVAQRDNPNVMNEAIFTVQETWLATGVGERIVTVAVTRTNGERGENSVRILVTNEGLALAPVVTELPNVVTVVENTEQVIPTSQPLAIPTEGGEVVVAPIATNTPSLEVNPNAPVAVFEGRVNVRRGPSQEFAPPLGIFEAGDSTTILATNEAGDWLKIVYNGGEGWILASIARVEGDISTLPREAGPPIPTPSA